MKKHMILAQLTLFLVGRAAVGPSYKSPELALSSDFHGGGGKERSELEAAVQASTRAVQLASVLHKKRLADLLTVLDAERTLRDVEDQLAASEPGATVNVIRPYKALGGGWEAFEQAGTLSIAG